MKRLVLLSILALAACSPKTDKVEPSSSAEVASSVTPPPAPASANPVVQTEIPAAFVGTWDATPEACKDTSVMKLTVTAKALDFWESTAYATKVTVTSTTDITVDADSSGEGEEWKDTLHMVLSDDGKTLTINDGKTGVRVRCS